ncbi:DUF397 domain-containing protein [Saccharopolyspora sp. SCSIO 74807]|uniref:DUF397 domain-containing protein n=1 Tax=Saccharopolyspora sp. SCSIO 74807 TaxID=3118084 RepID=UPI0030CBF25B
MIFDNWKKSSRSGTSGGNCLEVGKSFDQRAFRDSKTGEESPILVVNKKQYRAFISAVKRNHS